MFNNRISNSNLSLSITLLFLAFSQSPYAADQQNNYKVHNLVSGPTLENGADHQDPDLVNGWGVAFNPDGVFWVSDNGTGKSTLYNGKGGKQNLVVKVPSAPTGLVFFGGSKDFLLPSPNDKVPSRFIFATEDGTLLSWASDLGDTAVEQVDNSSKGAIYKGLTLSADGQRYLLYATDFHNGKVDVFDGKFEPVTLGNNAFKDPKIPSEFAPFGIQAINGVIFVTYAKQDSDAHDDEHGKGLGYVDAFDANGVLIQRVAAGGKLNAPWGLALAPANFGESSNHLLVGNFGDGAIIAYDLTKHSGGKALNDAKNKPIKIDGLWGISFGNGLNDQETNTLFFAAGPNEEQSGLFGRIDVVENHPPK